jgi:glycosyltransferase involved in cell wall biosynthesis
MPRACENVHLLPHPVHERFILGEKKMFNNTVNFVTVGRWGDLPQKRVDILIDVTTSLICSNSEFNMEIFGEITDQLTSWHNALAPQIRCRVTLQGLLPNDRLVAAYQRSHVYLCVSAYESFLIAGAEAMCCGCSIVACNSALLPGPRWFSENDRGTLSKTMNAQDITNAAKFEAEKWQNGDRDPEMIGAWAQREMHAKNVALAYARAAFHEPPHNYTA